MQKIHCLKGDHFGLKQLALVGKMGRKITYSMPEQEFKSNYEVLLLFFAFANANYMSENGLYLKHGFSHEEDTWNIVIHSPWLT